MTGDSFDPDKSSGHGELLVRLDQQQMRLLELMMPSRVPMASTKGSIGSDRCQERKFLDCNPKILDTGWERKAWAVVIQLKISSWSGELLNEIVL